MSRIRIYTWRYDSSCGQIEMSNDMVCHAVEELMKRNGTIKSDEQLTMLTPQANEYKFITSRKP